MSTRASYRSLVEALSGQVEEVFPWDLMDEREQGMAHLLLDVRCPHEYDRARIQGSINVPRGILEIAADYGYEETEPELVTARERRVILICRSGNRSILAAHTLSQMGYVNVASLRTGLRGWNDYELPLFDKDNRQLPLEIADDLFEPRLTAAQLGPV
ncbi:MAG: rhodanese-like domain-containing protein [Gammaproteobacteria bacterium SHHR-1]|uniref:rhodanese-like domain-containing protein n=1 Tax=Magnetovirga frankeli TaxID=947516 RepID=UPI001293A987|nr:rhodanese-like domain-containing protein [gamma proteobacterium SS-5]